MTGKTTWRRRSTLPFASSTKANWSRSRPPPAISWSATRVSQTDGSSSATSMRSGAKTKRPSPAIVVCWRSSTARRTTSTQSTSKGSKTRSPNSISRRQPEPPATIEFADGSSHVDLANRDQQTPPPPQTPRRSLKAKLAAAGEASKIIVYADAGHGFFADYRPGYNRADAEASWRQATSWLKEHGA